MKSFKESTYWNIWGDCCKLHKHFYGVKENDDAAWSNSMKEAGSIRSKYKGLPEGEFAEKMVLLVSSEIDEKAKGDGENATKKQTQHTAEQP